MSPVTRALIFILLSAASGVVAKLLFTERIGWMVFASGLLLQFIYHLRHFIKLESWSRQPLPSTDLEGKGAWDEVFARLYRHERDLRTEIEAARQNAKLFAIAGQAMIDGLISVDSAGRIEWCNASAEDMLGLDRHIDTGQAVANLVRHPDFVAYLNQGDFSQPQAMRSPRNPEQLLSIRVVAYGGRRRLLQIRDVTQAERIDQMRRDFVANVSHELRTPLTVLVGFVETLRDLDLKPEDRSRYLGLMAEQSERMRLILDELLVLSNLESAPPPPTTERIDMTELTARLLRDAEALSAGCHTISLEKKGSGDLVGAEEEIIGALSNLVSNAVRYTPEGGKVSLYWNVDEHGAEFAVEDTGIGIDAKHIPRLTERFYRVDRSRSRETGGTGLGLAIAKHSLSRHQAILDIQSTPGKGSRFSARFPASRLAPLHLSSHGS